MRVSTIVGFHVVVEEDWRAPKPLDRLKLNLSMETSERLGFWGTFPALSTLEGYRGVLELRDGTRRSVKQLTHSSKPTQNQQTSWLTQGWSTFSARKRHGQLQTHKTHHIPDSGEATTFPHIVYSAPPRRNGIRMAFCLGIPKRESRNRQG
jgi:hypothetical protein